MRLDPGMPGSHPEQLVTVTGGHPVDPPLLQLRKSVEVASRAPRQFVNAPGRRERIHHVVGEAFGRLLSRYGGGGRRGIALLSHDSRHSLPDRSRQR